MTDADGERGLDAHGDPRARPEQEWERQARTIDHAPKSGAGTKSDGQIDAAGYHFHVTDDKTKWQESDTPEEKIERFGDEHDKWEWLQRLNRSEDVNTRSSENRFLARVKDLRQLLDLVDFRGEQNHEWVLEEATDLLRELHKTERGLDNGHYSVELMEVAIITVAARRLAQRQVASFDELQETDPIHSLATDGTQAQKLREWWLPEDAPPTRDARNIIHEHLRTE